MFSRLSMWRAVSCGAGLGLGRPAWRRARAMAAAVVWISAVGYALAAESPPARGHIFLPPTRGATVLSTYIDAQARYVAALGDYAEAVSIARRHQVEAFSREMDNSLKWVDTYFKRRELRNAYVLKENPSYLDRLRSQAKIKEGSMYDYPPEIQKGDRAVKLNWLLHEIRSSSLAYSAVYGSDDRYVNSPSDLKLRPEDANHIWLTEANAQYGQKLIFRASDAEPFAEGWPLVFQAPEFELARKAYQDARTKGLNEIRTKQEITWETFQEMQQAVDGLAAELERKYPKSERKGKAGHEWNTYYGNGRRFVESQAASVMRIAATNRMETFDGSNRFEGDSLFELIRHLCGRGLEFAPPKPGDEPTYGKLLDAMRYIWLEVRSSNST